MLPKEFEGKSACCCTGHRPFGLPDGGDATGAGMCALAHALLHCVGEAAELGVRTFYCGGAAGFDTFAAEAVLVWKERYYPDIRLCLALPERVRAGELAPDMRLRYDSILARADDVYYATVGSLKLAYLQRNRYMVEHADCCIAYLKTMSGGTLYTVNYALERGLSVYNLAQYDNR